MFYKGSKEVLKGSNLVQKGSKEIQRRFTGNSIEGQRQIWFKGFTGLQKVKRSKRF